MLSKASPTMKSVDAGSNSRSLRSMLKGGVIMDVTCAEQAKVAQQAGACAVMALDRFPLDPNQQGVVAKMSDPKVIKHIMNVVSVPVMAKCRIGHFVEAQILQQLSVDCIDESEALTITDDTAHVNKNRFKVPFVCGCRNLSDAFRRISEGAYMIRTKEDTNSGDLAETVRQLRTLYKEIRRVQTLDDDEMFTFARENAASLELVQWTKEHGRLPVLTFASGGISTPADAALCMQLGADGVFVGNGMFMSTDPAKRARALVAAVTHFKDPQILADVSEDLGQLAIMNVQSVPKQLMDRDAVYAPPVAKKLMYSESYSADSGEGKLDGVVATIRRSGSTAMQEFRSLRREVRSRASNIHWRLRAHGARWAAAQRGLQMQ